MFINSLRHLIKPSLYTYLALFYLSFFSTHFNLTAQNLHRFDYSSPHMGTEFNIILYAEDRNLADSLVNKTFQRVAQLNQIMSDYLPDSEVSLLSKEAGSRRKIKVSKDLFKVLKRSKRWSRKTNGKFDVTIGPLTKIWRRAFRQQEFPDSIQIKKAKSKVNYKWLKLGVFSKKAKLKKKGMRIDLGGIAKGYAIDEAFEFLMQQGIEYALIEGGGDLRYSDPPPGKASWKILSSNFENIESYNGKAIATSGDTYQYLEWEGQRYSHLIHPKTGYGIHNQKIITAIAKNCMDADALASVASLLSNKELKKWEMQLRYKD